MAADPLLWALRVAASGDRAHRLRRFWEWVRNHLQGSRRVGIRLRWPNTQNAEGAQRQGILHLSKCDVWTVLSLTSKLSIFPFPNCPPKQSKAIIPFCQLVTFSSFPWQSLQWISREFSRASVSLFSWGCAVWHWGHSGCMEMRWAKKRAARLRPTAKSFCRKRRDGPSGNKLMGTNCQIWKLIPNGGKLEISQCWHSTLMFGSIAPARTLFPALDSFTQDFAIDDDDEWLMMMSDTSLGSGSPNILLAPTSGPGHQGRNALLPARTSPKTQCSLLDTWLD